MQLFLRQFGQQFKQLKPLIENFNRFQKYGSLSSVCLINQSNEQQSLENQPKKPITTTLQQYSPNYIPYLIPIAEQKIEKLKKEGNFPIQCGSTQLPFYLNIKKQPLLFQEVQEKSNSINKIIGKTPPDCHKNTFILDKGIQDFFKNSGYCQLTPEKTEMYRHFFSEKYQIPIEKLTDNGVQAVYEDNFLKKIEQTKLGVLAGLTLKTPVLSKDEKFAEVFANFLTVFFLLDDTMECCDSETEARNYAELAIDVLGGKITTKQDIDSHAERLGVSDTDRKRYYLAMFLRESLLQAFMAGGATGENGLPKTRVEVEESLKPWVDSMKYQFDSTIVEVQDRKNPLLLDLESYEKKRKITIGNQPCNLLIEAYLGIKEDWNSLVNSEDMDRFVESCSRGIYHVNDAFLHKELWEHANRFSPLKEWLLKNEDWLYSSVVDWPESIQKMLPLNGCLLLSRKEKISIKEAMEAYINKANTSIKQAIESLNKMVNNPKKELTDNQVEALLSQYYLVVASALWELLSSRYTHDGNATDQKEWMSLLKKFGVDLRGECAYQ